MHGYAGNPNSYPLSVEIIDDSDAPNATNFNTTDEGTLDRTAWLHARAGGIPALNWGPEFLTASGSGGFAALQQGAGAWGPLRSTFFLLAVTPSGTPLVQVWYTYGLDPGGDNTNTVWAQFGPNLLTTDGWLFSAVAEDPVAEGFCWIAGTDNVATHNAVHVHYTDGASWTLAVNLTSTGYYYGVEIATLNGLTVIGVAGTGDCRLMSRNRTGWDTDFVPAITMAAGSTWLLKANGTQMVAIPSSVGVTSVYQSTDGATWTTSTNLTTALGGSAATSTVVGLAWSRDAGGPCWIAAIQPASGPPVFARSPDGLVWSMQSGGMTATPTIVDMAAVGDCLCATLADTTPTGGNPPGGSGSIFSVDGGVTWYQTQAWFSFNATLITTAYSRARIVSSGLGFLMLNTYFCRFSSLIGLPPTAL